MRSNIDLISNIYIIQTNKTIQSDRQFHRQIRGKKALKKLLQLLEPSLTGINDEQPYNNYLHLLTEEQKIQWEQDLPCSFSNEQSFGFVKKNGKLILENRCENKKCPKKYECY